MAGWRIKAESFPERCEVCHRSDLFEPQTGNCARCKDILPTSTHHQSLNINRQLGNNVTFHSFPLSWTRLVFGMLALFLIVILRYFLIQTQPMHIQQIQVEEKTPVVETNKYFISDIQE